MIIACDTSSIVCSVAVTQGERVLSKWEESGAHIHIEKLSPFLSEALDYCSSAKGSLHGFAIAIGPGSFNGLRIGLATMKALALSLDLPLIPISSTDAMAFGLRENLQGKGRAVIFSHRNFVHYADYAFQGDAPVGPPEYFYGPWEGLYSEEIDHYFGTADRGFAEWLKGDGQLISNKFTAVNAQASDVGLLAEMRFDEAVKDLDQLEPFYNAQYEAKKWVPPLF